MKILKTNSFFIKSFFLFVFLTLTVTILSIGFFEPYAYNFMMKYVSAPSKAAPENTVIIAIDDKSISYHRWPWPREYYAQIINYLSEYTKPNVIGFDAIIPGYDRNNPNSDKKFFDAVKNSKNLVVGFDATTDYITDLNQTKLYNKEFKDKFQIIKISKNPTINIPQAYVGILESPKQYFDSAKYAGSVKVSVDSMTGTLTRADQIISIDGDLYPNLALQMYMVENNAKEIIAMPDKLIIPKTNKSIPIHASDDSIKSNLQFYRILNEDGYTHNKYSAIDIIKSYENLKQGKTPIIDPKTFDRKTVFIGASAKGKALSLDDALPTPINENKQPGTDILATNYDNIVRGEFIQTMKIGYLFLIIIATVITTFIFICKFSFFVSLIISILFSIFYFFIAVACYKNGYALSLTPVIAMQILTSIFGYSYRFIVEGKNKEKIKNAMGKYLSQGVMQNVVNNIDNVKLGGKRAMVTVLFSDIRGFTSMSEKMTAEDVSNILNEYFSEMEPIITKYNGVINKFIGDAVMAIFGEPIQDLHHPINAVKCAYEMLKKVSDLQDKWIFEGKPKIEIGIGINTGDAFVGNIGSEKRLEYTVIGDTVNLASRIEGFNKIYHTNLLVSASTYAHITDIADVIKISDVQIRGKSRKIDIYEILRLNDNNFSK